ncbi:MAG: BREX-2 system phosphatase PglZ [Isosphaeraceae bacterium]|nr:BREX-2 system phosphatase PglZ [Isosphaeraceae bacterium]
MADVLRCVEANARPDALPIGLAAAVVFSPKAKGQLEKAAGKMEERFLGRTTPSEGAIRRWAEAATEVIRLQITDPRLKLSLRKRADEILQEVGAEHYAYLSPISPVGFNQRLARFGKELSRTLQGEQYDSTASLVEARAEVGEHELAGRERRRLERADMAIRLVRWLHLSEQQPPSRAQSLVEAAKEHVADGGFADWARLALRLGDPVRELSEAYGKLFDRVTERREAQARHFSELLRAWTESNSESPELTPVERILEAYVAPLAAYSPVLLVVVDGMSIAVCRELLSDLIGHDWIPLARSESPSLLSPGLATIPSVTEVSRTSLFCGRLRPGASGDEQNGFATHPSLCAESRSGHPPVLFHKPALRDEGDAVLAAEVRAEIASAYRRIVGVMINAVDDLLLKGEQIDLRWSRDTIPVLSTLLHEAKAARRTVIITSDHGHVLDSRTEYRAHEGGERWRVAEGQPEPFECRMAGPRVVIPESKVLFAPWSERVRYGVKKNGYHGGVTPQEMIVPIVVLSPTEAVPEGWTEAAFDQPPWWDEQPFASPPLEAPAPPPHPKAGKPRQTPLLFDLEDADEPAAPPQMRAAEEGPEWIDDLFRSPTFKEQKKLAGRTVPPDDTFRGLLLALERRGGKLTSGALAIAMNYPAMRLRGLLAVMQRVLNIEGYAVLTRDDASDTVELNRELLKRQFDLR